VSSHITKSNKRTSFEEQIESSSSDSLKLWTDEWQTELPTESSKNGNGQELLRNQAVLALNSLESSDFLVHQPAQVSYLEFSETQSSTYHILQPSQSEIHCEVSLSENTGANARTPSTFSNSSTTSISTHGTVDFLPPLNPVLPILGVNVDSTAEPTHSPAIDNVMEQSRNKRPVSRARCSFACPRCNYFAETSVKLR
jgi:hypothetical protein